MMVVRNLDHVTIAAANAESAIEFFKLLGFEKQHVAVIDGGTAAQYMGMPDIKAQHITLAPAGVEPRFEIQLLQFDQHLHAVGDEVSRNGRDIAHAKSEVVSTAGADPRQATRLSNQASLSAGIARTDSTPSIAAIESISASGIALSTSTSVYAISPRDLFTML